ncbi:MAG: hypothetical protein Pars92KO_10170 [Parasphingorhabdus sp.]
MPENMKTEFVVEDPIKLAGLEVIDLWSAGKDAWNEWVRLNPVADIDFSGLDLSAKPNNKARRFDIWSFAQYQFPNGRIDFSGVKFGDGLVNFWGATFGDGDVCFHETNFGSGDVWFGDTKFGNGSISFDNARFKDGKVDFFNASIRGNDRVSFRATSFNNCEIDFRKAKIKTNFFTFSDIVFQQTNVNFNEAEFNGGLIVFNKVVFDATGSSFSLSKFENSTVKFWSCSFTGPADFQDLKEASKISELSFIGSKFDQTLNISANQHFECVIDLTQTKLANQVILDGVFCNFKAAVKDRRLSKNMAADPLDTRRYRRLKEITLNNRNYSQALNFHVGEMQSRRWHETNWLTNLFEFLFRILGDYGRSVVRPLGWLLVSLTLFAVVYSDLARKFEVSSTERLVPALSFSLGQMLPFIPISREARSVSASALFGETIPQSIIYISSVQSLISVILLFLLGLGLRNMFRV